MSVPAPAQTTALRTAVTLRDLTLAAATLATV